MEVERADLVVVRGRETISREEFLDAYEAAIHLPGFSPGDPILFDLTEASLVNLTNADCRLIAEHEDRRRVERGTGRCALVVSATVDFGVSRVLQAYREFSFEESQIRVFQDIENATSWLTDSA